MIPLLLAGLAAGLALYALRLRARVRSLDRRIAAATRELEHTQEAFSHFAPRRVVDQVLRTGAAHSAERTEVTILFADLVGFTRMSETLDPAVLVGILNGYFERAGRAVADHRGHISKFIGDGIMALFGAIERNPWQCQDAVAAGQALLAAVADYNRQLAAEDLPTLQVAIGIHTGEVIAGVVGSESLLEFTVLGHHVNMAARVESLTRSFDVPLLITRPVRDKVVELFELQEMEPMPLKGIAEPVATWSVSARRR